MSNQRKENPVEHIGSMVGVLQTTVKQLESLSRMISSISPTAGEEPAIEAADIGRTMELFTLHLAAINDAMNDVLGSVEQAMKRPLDVVNQ